MVKCRKCGNDFFNGSGPCCGQCGYDSTPFFEKIIGTIKYHLLFKFGINLYNWRNK